ncbi:MAG: AzlD domain-containing protein [Lachnospiraceae bacterium]|nr:AzlD domain-containing protein [Lachnospiraceae bacterium]
MNRRKTIVKAFYRFFPVIAGASVVGMQAWKRNSVLSILLGTIVYMILIRFI